MNMYIGWLIMYTGPSYIKTSSLSTDTEYKTPWLSTVSQNCINLKVYTYVYIYLHYYKYTSCLNLHFKYSNLHHTTPHKCSYSDISTKNSVKCDLESFTHIKDKQTVPFTHQRGQCLIRIVYWNKSPVQGYISNMFWNP